MAKFPPRGYKLTDYPQPHNFGYRFSLDAEDTTRDSTMIPLIRMSEKAFFADAQTVNPNNGTFAEETGVTIHHGSIIPRLNISISASITKAGIETDKIRGLRFMWFPIYMSFEEDYTAIDTSTSKEVEDILRLTHTVTDRDAQPTYGTKLTAASNHPLSTVNDGDEAIADWGLTTDASLEAVAFDVEEFWDSMSYYQNKGKMAKVVGNIKNVLVTRDRPYIYTSNNYTHPKVKRGNDYTFCAIMFHLYQGTDFSQVFNETDVGTANDHLDIRIKCRYDEWHPLFDQTRL